MEEDLQYLVGTPIIDRSLYPEFETSEELIERHKRNQLRKNLFHFEPVQQESPTRKLAVLKSLSSPDFEHITGFTMSPTSSTPSTCGETDTADDITEKGTEKDNEHAESFEQIYTLQERDGSAFQMTNPLYGTQLISPLATASKLEISAYQKPSFHVPRESSDEFHNVSSRTKRLILFLLTVLIFVLVAIPSRTELISERQQRYLPDVQATKRENFESAVFYVVKQATTNYDNIGNLKSLSPTALSIKTEQPLSLIKQALHEPKRVLKKVLNAVRQPLSKAVQNIGTLIGNYIRTTLTLLVASEAAIILGGGWFLAIAASTIGARELLGRNKLF
jgi:hypothetical protein